MVLDKFKNGPTHIQRYRAMWGPNSGTEEGRFEFNRYEDIHNYMKHNKRNKDAFRKALGEHVGRYEEIKISAMDHHRLNSHDRMRTRIRVNIILAANEHRGAVEFNKWLYCVKVEANG